MDYAEIISEVTQRVGDPNIAVRAGLYTNLAEFEINKALRTAEQEATLTFTTDANGEYVLPADFSAVRSLRKANYSILQIQLEEIEAGSKDGYAFRGGSLVTSYSETELEMDYYAELPSLEANGTNWLSASDPQIYIYAIAKQAYLGAGNVDAAQAAEAYLATLIGAKTGDDFMRRFKGTRMVTGKVNP